ncbi:hypothetical protein ACIBTV_18735 [Micromonospora sp. NPDC049366]|uniref:hypothetical protein n=1 Tax=Micromonospora sp. NPDC049366 TaxID=3364271 RepID=UPI00379F8323
MRARRLVAVASVAVGLVALAGCRTEPGVAAYVGDHRITEEQVTSIVEELRPEVTASPSADEEQAADPAQPGAPQVSRSEVVTTLVLLDVCRQLSADNGYQPRGQVSPEQVAQQTALPAEAVYVKRFAELHTCMSGVPGSQPVAPTKAELDKIIEIGRAAGAIPAEFTDEQAASRLDGDQLRAALASRKTLVEAADAYDVSVNPRYRPLVYPLLSFEAGVPAVSVPLGEEGPAVTAVSTPEPVASSAAPEAPGTES